jgi:hypothetical protein
MSISQQSRGSLRDGASSIAAIELLGATFTVRVTSLDTASAFALRVLPKVMHAFWNPTAAPVRFLSLVAPGSCERYFEELTAMITGTVDWSPAAMSDEPVLAARYDTLLPNT